MSTCPQCSTLHQLASSAAVARLLSAGALPAEDACLLIEEAVFAAAELARHLPEGQLYGLQLDAEEAGVALIGQVRWLDDGQWLELIGRHGRCVSW